MREGDIESVERNLGDRTRRPDGKSLPREGRIVIDKRGNRVIYNVDKDGKVRITHQGE